LLDALPLGQVGGYQPYWATRASLLDKADDSRDADAAYAMAIGLADDPAIRTFLLQRRSKLGIVAVDSIS
jgi:RNA polymerase sigma-70 factor (ECF subfamily)